ncbi:MAG: hypothetical protein ACI92E_001142 [Oceanicoccus sp.]
MVLLCPRKFGRIGCSAVGAHYNSPKLNYLVFASRQHNYYFLS